MIRSDKLRKSARGQGCTLQIPGVCNHDDTTTVLAHLPDGAKGMGMKSDDICAAFSCAACHDLIDRRDARWPGYADDLEFFMRRAMVRTWRVWIEQGLIRV